MALTGSTLPPDESSDAQAKANYRDDSMIDYRKVNGLDERLPEMAQKILTPLMNKMSEGDGASMSDDEKRYQLMKKLVEDAGEEVPMKCVFEKQDEVMDEAKAKQVVRDILINVKMDRKETPAANEALAAEEPEEKEEEEVSFDVDNFR